MAGLLVLTGVARCSQATDLRLDGAAEGRVYEGHGAVSAGATTRLLIDYPEPQRSQILDYLFLPGYGAALQHLKVEIGGGVVSGAGTEPTHMRTADDQNYRRGYEWWLMKEAKARNPDIILDCLAWGAPGWIGGGTYTSQDMAIYVANFIHGAKRIHNLDIAYTGVRNESAVDPNWIVTLRNTLDAAGLSQVKIVAGDEWNGTWNIVEDMISAPAISNAIDVVGAHYPSHGGHGSPANAKALGQPLWGSEEGIGGPSWSQALSLARLYNRNYIVGKMTKSEIWSPISSYYDILTAPGSGLMRANQPWSGTYEVSPAIWATAHTTQFAQPGWKYLEGGASTLLPGGGSLVTLKSDNGSDYSVVVETSDAGAAQTLTFHLTNGLSTAALRVWKTTQASPLVPVSTLVPAAGSFSYTFDPGCIYSLSTVGGQGRGSAVSPSASGFPLPYVEDFESYDPGGTPRYFSDQAGTFEVITLADGKGQGLGQVLPQSGIRWIAEWYPYTVAGDVDWRDYEINADVLLEGEGFVSLLGRVLNVPGFWDPVPRGYWLKVASDPGGWELRTEDGVLGSGNVGFAPGQWHRLRLTFMGRTIGIYIDGALVGEVKDGTYPSGMAAVGCGWHHAQFDNICIFPRHLGPRNLAPQSVASVSSAWQNETEFNAAKANDQLTSTRWNAAWPTSPREWIELNFGAAVRFNRATLVEFSDHIGDFRIQYWNGATWSDAAIGNGIAYARHLSFPMVTTTRARLLLEDLSASPSLYEFQLYSDFDPPNRALAGTLSASSVWQNDDTYTAARAGDGVPSTRWSAAAGDGSRPWLEVDLGAAVTVNKTVTREFLNRVTSYEIQGWADGAWQSLSEGEGLGPARTDRFAPIHTSRVRLQVRAANNTPSIYEFEVYHDPSASASVVVNEWMVHNATTTTDPADGQFDSWFELHNPGMQSVDLEGYHLSGDRKNRSPFRVPAGYAIPSGGYLLVWADGEPHQNGPGSDLHVSFTLTNAIEIGVFTATGVQVDVVKLRDQGVDRSDGSIPDGTYRILPTARPSPRRSNNQVRAMSMLRGVPAGSWTLGFAGIPDRVHLVQINTNLAHTTWTEAGRVMARPDGSFRYSATAAPTLVDVYRSTLP